MKDPIYIFGHKNPDADAICSAIAYAKFKEQSGQLGYVAARCGNSNDRIDSILQRFSVPLPVFIGDVTPRVQDIMIQDVIKTYSYSTCAEALEKIDQHDIRAIPVVNESNRLEGLVSVFDLGEFFIPKPDSDGIGRIKTSVNDIIKALKAGVLTLHEPDRIERLFVRIAAMGMEGFHDMAQDLEHPVKDSIIVVGDRIDIQQAAIDVGVRVLIIVGESSVDPAIIKAAEKNHVSIIASPYGAAATAWCIRSATRVSEVYARDVLSFKADERLSDVKKRIVNTVSATYPVVDEQGGLIGVFSKTNFLAPVKTQIVLVDHNEISQAVPGASEVKILEIIDHHRLGNRPSQEPILFINRPVGSTCTIVADLYRSAGLTPSASIAGVLMGGIISDTLNLNSPTTTPVDAQILPWLSAIANIRAESLSEIIFSSGSIILKESPDKVIRSDAKIYQEGSVRFSVSQVEELGLDSFWQNEHHLSKSLESYRINEELDFSALFVTDINTQDSILLVSGNAGIIERIAYPAIEQNRIFDLKGIVSRKKQLIPYLSGLLNDA